MILGQVRTVGVGREERGAGEGGAGFGPWLLLHARMHAPC